MENEINESVSSDMVNEFTSLKVKELIKIQKEIIILIEDMLLDIYETQELMQKLQEIKRMFNEKIT